jgi:3-dehydroquinate dehydratase-1
VSTFAPTLESLGAKVEKARRLNSDLIELRLDAIEGLDSRKMEKVGNLLAGKNEILTIRSPEEGAFHPILDKRRVALIRETIASLEPPFIDVEIVTLRRYHEIIAEIERTHTRLIASFHDVRGNKSTSDLAKKMLSFQIQSTSLFATKVASKANALRDNLKVLALYSRRVTSRSKLVAFCMGRLGVPSRLLCLFMGSPYTYVSLPDEPAASGQLDIVTMRKMIQGRA